MMGDHFALGEGGAVKAPYGSSGARSGSQMTMGPPESGQGFQMALNWPSLHLRVWEDGRGRVMKSAHRAQL